jgi:hypothetical protein
MQSVLVWMLEIKYPFLYVDDGELPDSHNFWEEYHIDLVR